MEYINSGKQQGAKVALGGERWGNEGYFIQPTIFSNVSEDMKIMQEEIFGPVCSISKFETEEEVIKRANATNAGLGACVWGKDVARAEKIGKQLEAGSVFINSWEKPTPQAFFGGHKESGIGGEWGKEGLKAYCNAQVMHSYKI